MLNIEKYKNEIITCGLYGFSITKENKFARCVDCCCSNCVFKEDEGCSVSKRVEWLTSEYKPLLSDEAKDFLKAIMQHFEDPKIYKVACYDNSGDILRVYAKNGNDKIRYDKSSELYEYFKCLEYDISYTPEELGL